MRWLCSDILKVSLGPGSATVERAALRMLRHPRRSPQPNASPLRREPEVQPRPLGAAGGGTRGDDASSTGSRSRVRLRTESGGRGSRSVLYTRRGLAGRGFAAARASADPPHLRPLFSSPCRRHGCGADPAAARLWRPERAWSVWALREVPGPGALAQVSAARNTLPEPGTWERQTGGRALELMLDLGKLSLGVTASVSLAAKCVSSDVPGLP